MKLFKSFFVLLFSLALANLCYAQKKTIADVDTKSFYNSESGITRLVNALESVNPNFLALKTVEKEEEFKRIATNCPDTIKGNDENATITSDAKERAVCIIIKDIASSLQSFQKKHGFLILLDAKNQEGCEFGCLNEVDITKQFIDEYNEAGK